jgi:DNA-binding CsgD family transcriptional regulator
VYGFHHGAPAEPGPRSTYFTTDIGSDPRYRLPSAMKKKAKSAALSRLSPREREVLKLVVEGRTSKEIAIILGVKPTSIDTYRSRIMGKLEINDIASLVRLAIRQGLIRP